MSGGCRSTTGRNVRELRHVLERAVIPGGNRLHLDLPVADRPSPVDPVAPTAAVGCILTADEGVALEQTNIQRTLRVTNGKIYGEDGAAKLLGLKPTFLTSHIKATNGYCNIEGSRRRRCRVVPLVAGDARPVCRPRCSAGR